MNGYKIFLDDPEAFLPSSTISMGLLARLKCHKNFNPPSVIKEKFRI